MDQYVDACYVSSVNLGNNCLLVYDINTGACIKNFRGQCISQNTLKPIGLKDYLISSQKDKPLLQCWEINRHDPMPIRMAVPGNVNALAVDEATGQFCILGIREKIFAYQLSSGMQIGVISSHYQSVSCLEFTSCGNYFASAGEDGFIYLWSLVSMIDSLHKVDRPEVQPHYTLGQHSDKVKGLAISGAGIRGILVSCSADRSLKVFELTTGRLRHNIIASAGLTSVRCNLIGSQIFTGGENGKVWVFNLLPHTDKSDLQLLHEGSKCHENAVDHLSLTPSGDTLLTGSKDGEVKVWSIVMSDKSSDIGLATLAFQRILHVGRGLITNILTKNINKEIFEASKLNSDLVVTAFNNQPKDSIFDTPTLIPIRKVEQTFNPNYFCTLASQLLLEEDSDDETSEKNSNVSKSEANDADSLKNNYIKKLKEANETLMSTFANKLLPQF